MGSLAADERRAREKTMRVRKVDERDLSLGFELDGPARTLCAIEP
jgi:hypothetical protein